MLCPEGTVSSYHPRATLLTVKTCLLTLVLPWALVLLCGTKTEHQKSRVSDLNYQPEAEGISQCINNRTTPSSSHIQHILCLQATCPEQILQHDFDNLHSIICTAASQAKTGIFSYILTITVA